jgi:integrase
MIRRFALALCAEDIRHEVPAADALGHATFRRRTPHIYTPDEIIRLLGAAAALLPAGSIRPLTYTTLFGLLAATGMRISEALAVRLDDITADGLVIRQTKFQKSRLLPLHNTTSQALNQYLSMRVQLRATADTLPSVPMMMRHQTPGNLDLRARKDNHAHAHAPATDRCRGGRHRERRP